eukprot:1235766-Rhodomonas_salina.1
MSVPDIAKDASWQQYTLGQYRASRSRGVGCKMPPPRRPPSIAPLSQRPHTLHSPWAVHSLSLPLLSPLSLPPRSPSSSSPSSPLCTHRHTQVTTRFQRKSHRGEARRIREEQAADAKRGRDTVRAGEGGEEGKGEARGGGVESLAQYQCLGVPHAPGCAALSVSTRRSAGTVREYRAARRAGVGR